jgi:hypothetical protein
MSLYLCSTLYVCEINCSSCLSANLVNEAFAIEEVGKSEESFAFRSRPRINPELLSKELENSQGTKWIVMETPCPVIHLLYNGYM